MNLNTKATLFFATLIGLLMAALVAISLYTFRSFSILSATENIRTAAEIVRVHLTDSMIHGTISKRESFLNRLLEVQGLKSAKVTRSPLVVQQFGPGLKQESATDEDVREAFRLGVPQFKLADEGDDLVFKGTIPYIASSHGTPNCLQCHQVKEGDVLGVVSMTMSITAIRNQALISVTGIVAVVLAFALLLILLMRRMLKPISSTARAVEVTVHKALEGDFKSHLEQKTNDEIGHIAADLNRLLKFLDDGLNRIGDSISRLTGRVSSPGENLLNSTIDMVDGLTKAAHFKQAIEEDETKMEIYQRLSTMLQHDHQMESFSIYELNNQKHQMIPIVVDGQVGGDCRWCDPQILIRPEACRARRTGHKVDGVTTPDICYAFRPSAEGERHLCFPVIQSGSVGSVLQLVSTAQDQQRLLDQEPFINGYLREASPVLETKRLMETLREANLRDPMTGLNNRRFLEEYVETLVSTAQRKKSNLAIMMLDLDFFKMVNDTYGHDAGDAVLKALAKVLKQSVRASDMVIRYGGEEFLIILQDTHRESADQVAEKIRVEVEKLKTTVAGVVIQKTISIGLSDFPTDSDTFWQAVKYADVALYSAKETGRNRVVRFDPSMWTDKKEY
ncbi:MAG: response regulator [Comamonadaceae bacterium]|nr:MAG: response regulator [Comamonadaceae bacterium]